MNVAENIKNLQSKIPENVTLVAVSKTKPNSAILEAYNSGQRIFGENKVQELADKYEALPKDIEWHMIGHLQRNKVKYIAPFVSLIHGVDSIKLLQEINKRTNQNNRTIDCLLQIHIAEEETKFGFSAEEVKDFLDSDQFKTFQNIKVVGLMGMATNTTDSTKVISEFGTLNTLFMDLKQKHSDLKTLSMGMSGDYELAIEQGSTMIRVGSRIFGGR